jgi:hypothetical protein
MLRLLERLKTRPQAVDLRSSLVQATRYCGLLEESLAAHAEARGVDPSARTSVVYTHFMLGDFEAAARFETENDAFLSALALVTLGRTQEARAVLEVMKAAAGGMLGSFMKPTELLIAGDHEGAAELGRPLYQDFPDPEGRFFFARGLAIAGRSEEALDFLDRVAPEYAALPPPGRDPWLAALDTTERYAKLLERVGKDRDAYREQYRAAQRA